MKSNNVEQDGENIPIKLSDKLESSSYYTMYEKKSKNKYFTKRNIIFFFVLLIVFIMTYLAHNNKEISILNNKIEELESKLQQMEKEVVKKKIGVAFISPILYGNGIGRLMTILTELLMKTGRYEVYLINEQSTELDFKYHKKVKREIQKKDEQIIRDFDEANDIQIYILNNDVSNLIEIYKSLGKKVIGVFHGV